MVFPGSLLMRDVLSNRLLVAASLFGMGVQQSASLLINFTMTFRETLADFRSDLRDFKVTAFCIENRVTEVA